MAADHKLSNILLGQAGGSEFGIIRRCNEQCSQQAVFIYYLTYTELWLNLKSQRLKENKMEAKYCDKCGKLCKADAITTIQITGMYTEDGEFDLCSKCKDKLADLLNW